MNDAMDEAGSCGSGNLSDPALNTDLRTESGDFVAYDRLTSFLYDLMRDHLPTSTVEKLFREAMKFNQPCLYSNGWLARYAQRMSRLLCGKCGADAGRLTPNQPDWRRVAKLAIEALEFTGPNGKQP